MDLEVPKYPPPPPPAPKRLSRPKITLQIPQSPYGGPPSAASRYSTPNKYHGWPPSTPGSHKHHPNFNPEWYLHMTQASDFIKNTAKSGLSFGEKTAFWIVSKLKHLSKKWFTHFFLMLCLVLYSVMGAAIFMALEGTHENNNPENRTADEVRRDYAEKISLAVLHNHQTYSMDEHTLNLTISSLMLYEDALKECTQKKTWTFINSMFYAGTIYTTIGKLNFMELLTLEVRTIHDEYK